MSDAVKIYHNPRCSKSRDTLSLLKANGIDPEVVLYLETPPDADTLRQLLKMLGMVSARELMRQKEAGSGNRQLMPMRHRGFTVMAQRVNDEGRVFGR